MEGIIQATTEETINSSNLSCFDWATLVPALLAIIISIWSAIWTVYRNNKSSYKSSLYIDILKKKLNEELPSLLHKCIDLSSKTCNDSEINKFEEFLEVLRKEILVFKYVDNKFYEKIDETIINIDENLVLISTNKKIFANKYEKLVEETKKLYKYTEKYLLK